MCDLDLEEKEFQKRSKWKLITSVRDSRFPEVGKMPGSRGHPRDYRSFGSSGGSTRENPSGSTQDPDRKRASGRCPGSLWNLSLLMRIFRRTVFPLSFSSWNFSIRCPFVPPRRPPSSLPAIFQRTPRARVYSLYLPPRKPPFR